MIVSEVTNPVVLNFLPPSSLDLLTQLIQKWKDWKISIASEQWKSLFIPQVDLREEVPIGMVKLSEMMGTISAETEGLEDCSQEESRRVTTSRTWGNLT